LKAGLSSPASTTSRRLWFVPGVDRACVANMGDVLDLFAEVPDPKLVCFGESLIHPIDQIRQPVPPEPARSSATTEGTDAMDGRPVRLLRPHIIAR
jgi:hypothetical protein